MDDLDPICHLKEFFSHFLGPLVSGLIDVVANVNRFIPEISVPLAFPGICTSCCGNRIVADLIRQQTVHFAFTEQNLILFQILDRV